MKIWNLFLTFLLPFFSLSASVNAAPFDSDWQMISSLSPVVIVSEKLTEESKYSKELVTIIEEAKTDCNDFKNGKLQIPSIAIKTVDLNKDGKLDEIFNFGAVECSSAVSLWSGSGGSWWALIVDGKITRFLARDLEVIYPFGDYPVVILSVHGSFCGRAGVVDCVTSTVWSHGDFQTLK